MCLDRHVTHIARLPTLSSECYKLYNLNITNSIIEMSPTKEAQQLRAIYTYKYRTLSRQRQVGACSLSIPSIGSHSTRLRAIYIERFLDTPRKQQIRQCLLSYRHFGYPKYFGCISLSRRAGCTSLSRHA